MNIVKSSVLKLSITDIGRLDAIQVIVENPAPSAGKIIITCYGESWTGYWDAIGDRTLMEFFNSCDEHYLAGKISSTPDTITDYNKISNDIGHEVDQKTMGFYLEDLKNVYGDDCPMYLPETTNPQYTYLCQIILTVQKAFAKILKENQNEKQIG